MCKRHLKPGVPVILDNGLLLDGRYYNRGIIKGSLDGEFWLITMFIGFDESVIVERYLTEIRTE